MSANGAFSSTLDYNFFGGGVVSLSGSLSTNLDPVFESSAVIPVFGEIQPQSLSLELTEAGIETPTIQASFNGSIDFTGFGTAEQGITTNGQSFYVIRTEFTANAEGHVVVSGTLDQTLDFSIQPNIYVFSEGPAAVSFDFSVAAQGTNVSTHLYSKDGANYCSIYGIDYNNVKIMAQSNSVKIIDNGIRQVEVIQN